MILEDTTVISIEYAYGSNCELRENQSNHNNNNKNNKIS